MQDISRQQVSGFGFFHNASFDPVNTVFNPMFFRYPQDGSVEEGGPVLHELRNRMNMFYLLSMFDTDVFPVGGQQRNSADKTVSDVSLAQASHCMVYGFSTGEFHAGVTALQDPDGLLTCYPRLQSATDSQ